MRRVLLALAFMGLVTGAAYADLSAGVFLAHHPAGLVYTIDTPTGGWCAQCNLQSCADQNNDNLPLGTESWVWYVVAAFPETSTWCGIEFGLQYTAGAPTLTAFGYCVPGAGLEIPGTGWPGAGTGTSVVTTDLPWTGTLVPVYYFAGYSYYGPGLVQITDNFGTSGPTAFADCDQVEYPAAAYGAIGWGMPGIDACPQIPYACCLPNGDCVMTSASGCVDLGGVWHEGFTCATFDCPAPMWACCIDYVCTMMEEADCLAAGGVWYENVDCATFACPVPSWACCLYDGTCVLTETEADCTAQGGVWHEGLLCGQVTCPVPDVCCVDHLCYFVHEDECATLGGVWHPEFVDCTDNPCEELTPADNTSWGTIKAIYR